jgi:hypothetical protein
MSGKYTAAASAAIISLKERSGSSQIAIEKVISGSIPGRFK